MLLPTFSKMRYVRLVLVIKCEIFILMWEWFFCLGFNNLNGKVLFYHGRACLLACWCSPSTPAWPKLFARKTCVCRRRWKVFLPTRCLPLLWQKICQYIWTLNSVFVGKYKRGKVEKGGLRAERQKEAVSEHSMERASLVHFTPFLNLNTWHKPFLSELPSNITMINNDSNQFLYSLPGFTVQQTFMRMLADQNGEKKLHFCFRILSEPLSIFRQENICRWNRGEKISVAPKFWDIKANLRWIHVFGSHWFSILMTWSIKSRPDGNKAPNVKECFTKTLSVDEWWMQCNVWPHPILSDPVDDINPGSRQQGSQNNHHLTQILGQSDSCSILYTGFLRAEIVTVPAFLHS